MSKQMIKVYTQELDNLEAAGLLKREIPAICDFSNLKYKGSKKKFINFTYDDFLGLGHNLQVQSVAQKSIDSFSYSSFSTRSLTGTRKSHHDLEKKLAKFLGFEECLIFESHLLTSMGVIDSLCSERDSIFVDGLSNHSLIDAVRISDAKKYTYQNNDMVDLEYQLKMSERSRFRVVVSDSVFGQDGRNAHVNTVIKHAKKYQALSVFDDSLGFGLIGQRGRGLCDYHELDQFPDLTLGSFKYIGAGVNGGFVVGEPNLIKWIRHSSRIYNLGAPLSSLNSEVVSAGLDILDSEDSENLESLRSNIRYLVSSLSEEGLEVINHNHPIVSVVFGDVVKTQKIIDSLYNSGIVVSGLCYPNVSQDSARIRLYVTAMHSEKDLDKLVKELCIANEKLK